MEYKDYYKILGVEKTASADEIKKAFRKLAKENHPDLVGGDKKKEEKFKEINEAYEVLGDEAKRKEYDAIGAGGFRQGMNFDPRDFGFDSYETTNAGGFSDFFNLFFGGAGKGRGNGGFSYTTGKAPRARYEAEVTITIEEGYRGTTRTLALGGGTNPKTVEVKIPKGITPGKKIRVRGEKFGIAGDIYVAIRFADGAKLEGLNLIRTLTLAPWEAYFGTKRTVETMDGKIRVTIPARVHTGSRIRVAKKGYRDMKGKTGDLYFEVVIDNPALNEKQEKCMQELMDLAEGR